MGVGCGGGGSGTGGWGSGVGVGWGRKGREALGRNYMFCYFHIIQFIYLFHLYFECETNARR